MITRRTLLASSAAAALAPLAAPAIAQAGWPNRFLKLIIPFPPGGGNDAVGRLISTRLSEMWGQQIIIENRGGAGSNIGAEAAARSEPDGYTIFFASLPLAINRFIYASLPYDALTDFAPISMLCTFPNLLGVPNSSPVKSVPELIAYAKENRGKMNFASSGIGTSPHLCGELFKRMTGIEMTHVPYRGAGPALNDLIAGRVEMMFNTIGAMLTQARGGQIRGLAVTSAQRVHTAPEFPTVVESGVAGFDVSAWYALFAPAKTPPEIVARMNKDIVAVLAEPTIKKRLEDLGVVVGGSTQQELGTFFKAEMEKWGPVIKAAGISTTL